MNDLAGDFERTKREDHADLVPRTKLSQIREESGRLMSRTLP